MGKSTTKRTVGAIGIDLGDRRSHFCEIDAGGKVIRRGEVPMTPEGFETAFGKRRPARIAIEVGAQSPWVSRRLQALGHEVIVANARCVKLISESDKKSDREDAQMLARIARLDPELLRPVHHRSEAVQLDLDKLRMRDLLVRQRTALVNEVRSLVKSKGARITKGSSESFTRRAREEADGGLRSLLDPILLTIDFVSAQVARLDKELASIAKNRYPVTGHLQQISGVGPITSLAFVLVLENPKRFRSSRSVGSYLGLRPRRQESGAQDPELRITKAGDGLMRKLLVQASQYILGPFGPDTDLRRFGERLASRGKKNAKKRAVVAVARKLSVLLHRLWVTGETYEPLRNSCPAA